MKSHNSTEGLQRKHHYHETLAIVIKSLSDHIERLERDDNSNQRIRRIKHEMTDFKDELEAGLFWAAAGSEQPQANAATRPEKCACLHFTRVINEIANASSGLRRNDGRNIPTQDHSEQVCAQIVEEMDRFDRIIRKILGAENAQSAFARPTENSVISCREAAINHINRVCQ